MLPLFTMGHNGEIGNPNPIAVSFLNENGCCTKPHPNKSPDTMAATMVSHRRRPWHMPSALSREHGGKTEALLLTMRFLASLCQLFASPNCVRTNRKSHAQTPLWHMMSILAMGHDGLIGKPESDHRVLFGRKLPLLSIDLCLTVPNGIQTNRPTRWPRQ